MATLNKQTQKKTNFMPKNRIRRTAEAGFDRTTDSKGLARRGWRKKQANWERYSTEQQVIDQGPQAKLSQRGNAAATTRDRMALGGGRGSTGNGDEEQRRIAFLKS